MLSKRWSSVWLMALCGIVALALVVGCAPKPVPEAKPPILTPEVKPIVLKWCDTSVGSSRTRAIEATCLEIEKRTGGRVKHEFYWAGSLVKAMDSLEAIKAGTAQGGGAPDIVYHPAQFPIWQFGMLQFTIGPDIPAAMKAAYEMYQTFPELKDEMDKQGVKFLNTYLYPTTIISTKPINKLEDLKGLRVRAVGSIAKWFAKEGGTASGITFYEVTEALARGTIDATIGYLYAHYAYKFHDYCKYWVSTPIGNTQIFQSWVNLDTFNKFPEDIKKIYVETWRDFYPEMVAKYTEEEVNIQLKAFKDAGVKSIELTPEEYTRWKDSAAFLNDDYYAAMSKAGIDGKKILSSYEELYKKYETKK